MRTTLLAVCLGGLVLMTSGCNGTLAPTVAADGVWYGRVSDPFAPPVDGLELTLTTSGNTITGSGRRYVDVTDANAGVTGTQSGASLHLTLRFDQFDATCVGYIHDAHNMTCRVDYGVNGAPEVFEMVRD